MDLLGSDDGDILSLKFDQLDGVFPRATSCNEEFYRNGSLTPSRSMNMSSPNSRRDLTQKNQFRSYSPQRFASPTRSNFIGDSYGRGMVKSMSTQLRDHFLNSR